MRRWLLNLVKCETILIVAAVLAVISCFFVPPDAQYFSYIHVNTISQLVCLMMVVCGFQRIGVFRSIGANLLTHNLYLKALTRMSTGGFLSIMAPYTLTAAILMIAFAFVFFSSRKVDQFEGLHGDDIEQSVLAPHSKSPKPDEIRVMGYGVGFTQWRVIVYSLLFVLCLCGVAGWIPDWIMVLAVVIAFIICDSHVFRALDWALPLTFIMFFIFIGNMRRVPGFTEIAQMWVGSHPMEVSVVSSQMISNVPTTILLSGFCDQWKMLIIGTNLGGMGTLIASMASLISYKSITHKYPHNKGRYLLMYTIVNLLFLAVLIGLAWIIE